MHDQDVLIIGDVNLDYLGRCPFFPAADQEVEMDELNSFLGGSGANAAVAAVGLGLKVAFFSALGSDAAGEQLRGLLRGCGVADTFLKTAVGQSSGMVFGAVTPDGERRLFCYRGANLALRGADVPDSLLQACRWLHLNGPVFEVALDLLARARRLGIPASLDPGSILIETHPDRLPELIALTDILLVNSVEFEMLTPGGSRFERVEYLLQQGVGRVVVKEGARGCVRYQAGKAPLFSPAFPIDPLDTTGAGDAFNAGLIYAVLNNFDETGAFAFANAVGAMASLKMGATSGAPESAAAVQEFIKKMSG